MESVRFEKFILLICGVYKHISRLKNVFAPEMGIKGVHVLWLYELRMHPEGLTAAELASVSMVDRALVSRELEELKRAGYVDGKGDGRNYNVTLRLTPAGEEVADRIIATVADLQGQLDDGITPEELGSFYETLGKLYRNFESIRPAAAVRASKKRKKDEGDK